MGAVTNPSYVVPKRSEALSQNADAFINWLFEELAGTFPAWKSAFDSQQSITTAKRIWFEALSENKIKRSEIEQGLRMARKSTNPFLPSVGQFIAWCKVIDYETLGLPSLEQLLKRLNHFAFFGLEEADKFSFKSDAEYWLITDLYRRERRYLWQESTLRSQAEQALLAMAKRIQAGENIPERAKAIEKPKEYIPAHPLVEAELRKRRSMKQEGWNG